MLSEYEIDSWEIGVYQGHSWFVNYTNNGTPTSVGWIEEKSMNRTEKKEMP